MWRGLEDNIKVDMIWIVFAWFLIRQALMTSAMKRLVSYLLTEQLLGFQVELYSVGVLREV
jgi:hypothetical protein